MIEKLQKLMVATIFVVGTNIVYGADVEKIYAPHDYTVIPPSPEASELLKYSEIPVNNFNGLPDVSFELFRLAVGNMAVPIVLSYHGGGIKQLDKEGNAGLGWSIISGACISRTVYGAPDEIAGGDYKMNGLFKLNDKEREFRTCLMNKAADYDPTDGGYFSKNNRWLATSGDRYMNGHTDLANDILHISGLGLSGTFIYNDEGNIVLSSENPVEISPNRHVTYYPNEFIVSDNSGITYKFSTEEKTDYEYPNYNNGINPEKVNYTSAWHITSMKDAIGNSIDFSYEAASGYEWIDYMSEISYDINDRRYQNYVPKGQFPFGTTTYYPQRLKSITGGGISITFDYDQIVNGNYKKTLVRSITVSSKDKDSSVKKFDLTYKKMPCQFNSLNNDFFNGYYEMLSEIKENDKAVYRFDYYNNDGNFANCYAACDFGGYYNGASNVSLIPTCDKVYGDNADRSVNPQAAIVGSLKTIYYPTGGSATIEWESNMVRYIGGAQITHVINNPSIVHTQTETLRMCLDNRFCKLKITNYKITEAQKIELDLTKYFNLNPDVLMQTEYEVAHEYLAEPYVESNARYPHVTIRKTGSSEKEPVAIYFLDKETIEKRYHKAPIPLSLPIGSYDFELLYPLEINGVDDRFGNYFLNGDSDAGMIFINKSVRKGGDLTVSNNDYWCGVRTKRIISNPGNGEEPIIKDYYYGDEDPRMSGGTVQFLPEYMYSYNKICPNTELPGFARLEVYGISSITFPNTPIGGVCNSVQYPLVTTRLSRQDRNYPDSYLHSLSETYRYTSSMDRDAMDYNGTEFLRFQPVGSRMYTSVAHRRGLLTSKAFGGFGEPSKKIAYDYNIYESGETSTFTTDAFIICDWTDGGGENENYAGYDYSIGKYSMIPYNRTVASETNTENNGFSSRKGFQYFYDGYTDKIDYKLVKCENYENSEGRNENTYYTYLKRGNIYTPFVETEVRICEGEVVEATRNEYDMETMLVKNKYALQEMPKSVMELVSPNQSTTKEQIAALSKPLYEYKYNNKGNLVEVSYGGNVLSSFLWGYCGQHPVLEATGVKIEELVAAASKAGFDQQSVLAGEIYSENSLKELSKYVRNRFPESEVTSLTYHWLVGIVDATDCRGIKTSYRYDRRSRLNEVRDMNSLLLRKYEYSSVWENVEL